MMHYCVLYPCGFLGWVTATVLDGSTGAVQASAGKTLDVLLYENMQQGNFPVAIFDTPIAAGKAASGFSGYGVAQIVPILIRSLIQTPKGGLIS